MKLLNLLTMALMAIFVSVNITSCSSDEESEELMPVEDDEEYVEIPLKLSINASIDITDEPITKSDYDNPVYAIEVREINPNTSESDYYAYGIFEDLDNISVRLKKNREYKIEAVLLYDFFSKWEFRANDSHEYVYHKTYTDAFIYLKDGFFYGVTDWFISNTDYYSTDLLEGDGFYGKIDNFSPLSNVVCSLELKRIASAIEVDIEGLTGGEIQCRINSPHTNIELEYQLTPSKPILSTMFVFEDFVTNVEANVRLYIDYVPNIGEGMSLVSGSYKFAKNKRKKIHIKLIDGETSGELNTSFNITRENVEFIDEEQIDLDCTIN